MGHLAHIQHGFYVFRVGPWDNRDYLGYHIYAARYELGSYGASVYERPYPFVILSHIPYITYVCRWP
jgi:hypothetical protein